MLFNKKFDLVVSLGEDCACTSYLRRYNLQDYSYPFDWLANATFNMRIELLVTDFKDFLKKENMIQLQKPNEGLADRKHSSYRDNVSGFNFYHDFKLNVSLEEDFNNVKEKYDRRIERLYKTIETSEKILFVWWSRDKHINQESIMNAYERLITKFKNKEIYLLIIEKSNEESKIYMADNYILLLKYDNTSFKHNPKWNETMGNEKNNAKFFSQIKKVRTLDWYLRIFIFKFVKVFIELIPNRELRHSLKKTWSYKFFRNKL